MSAPNGQIWTTGVAITTDPASAQNGSRAMAMASDHHAARPAFQSVSEPIADSVRGMSKWVESLIDSQINLMCALLETASQGCFGAVTRALIGISGVVLAA